MIMAQRIDINRGLLRDTVRFITRIRAMMRRVGRMRLGTCIRRRDRMVWRQMIMVRIVLLSEEARHEAPEGIPEIMGRRETIRKIPSRTMPDQAVMPTISRP